MVGAWVGYHRSIMVGQQFAFSVVCGLRLKKRLSTEHKIQDSTTR